MTSIYLYTLLFWNKSTFVINVFIWLKHRTNRNSTFLHFAFTIKQFYTQLMLRFTKMRKVASCYTITALLKCVYLCCCDRSGGKPPPPATAVLGPKSIWKPNTKQWHNHISSWIHRTCFCCVRCISSICALSTSNITGAKRIMEVVKTTQAALREKLYKLFTPAVVVSAKICVVFLTESGNISVSPHNLSLSVSSGCKRKWGYVYRNRSSLSEEQCTSSS